MSKIRYADLGMCFCHSFQRILGTTITCAELVRLCEDWSSSYIKIMSTPGEGLQMKVPSLNLLIQTPSIFSSPPSWSCPLKNHPSGSIVSIDLPISESHYSIHLPNGSDIFKSDSPRRKWQHGIAVHNPLIQTSFGDYVSSLINHPSAGKMDESDLTPVPHAQEMKSHH